MVTNGLLGLGPLSLVDEHFGIKIDALVILVPVFVNVHNVLNGILATTFLIGHFTQQIALVRGSIPIE
jgi:hypothetical protein